MFVNRARRWYGGLLALALLLEGGFATADETVAPRFTARSGGLAPEALLAQGDAGFAGLAKVRPVLAGVLYRAGIANGDPRHKGLGQAQLQALCTADFSRVVYLDDGRRARFGTTDCGKNSLVYAKGSSTKPSALLRRIGELIDDPDQGPLLLHCDWGVHSSGVVAAMALVQFCGWSADEAKAYWQQTRDGAPCKGGCEAWIDARFRGFTARPDLVPNAATQARLCPARPQSPAATP